MPITFRQATLPNGLTVIAEVDPDAHTAAAGFFVRTGARDEDTPVMGVSHFLEHMMFKGSERRNAEQVNEGFDDLGAEHNAFTSGEVTAFWAHTLPEKLSDATDILADILRPALRQADFDEEKGVILEEIAMYDDQPFWVLYEHAMEAYYGSHPLGHRVLGTNESITALTRDQMKSYFDHRYAADNTVLALAGRLDFDAMTAHATKLCGGWERTNPRRAYPEVAGTRPTVEVPFPKASRHYELMAMPAPAVQDDDRYAAALIAEILGDVDGSRLYWALVEPGLAEEAQAQYEGRDRDGVMFVYFVCPTEDAPKAREVALTELRGLADSLTEDDLLRARSKIATSVTLAGERPAGRMRRLGHLWVSTGRYESLDDDLRRIESLTMDDLRRVLQAYPLEPRTVASLRP
ncbi:MAG: insulinase family protein [Phycisphaerales bacterium]|nr:insulinase family protein [Phycisphaerales bacterium]